MSGHERDVEEQRATMREELAGEAAQSDEEVVDEASLAPPGHLGERMNEAERRERF
jgi:hypothetical protein